MSAEGAAGQLAGAYEANADAVKKLAEQIKSWSGSYSQDALNPPAEAGQGMTPPPSGGGPSSPISPMSSSNNPNRWAAIGGVLGTATKAAVNWVGRYGQSQLGQQVALNSYAQYSSYMGNAPTRAVIQQAVGTGNGGYRNNIANGTADAAAQFNILQQASGSEIVASSPLGRAMRAASFTAGTINPGLGGQASAQFAAQVYSPQTSLYMRQMGLAPLQPYAQGTPTALPDLARGILSKMFRGGRMSDQGLAQMMRPQGAGQLAYQFVTGGQIPLGTMQPIMQAVNKLQNQGVSNQQADWALSSAGQGNKRADQFLKQHIGTTDLMQMREAQSANMARTGDQYSPYTEGLSAAATAVEFFNSEFASFMKHISYVTGLTAGTIGTTKALEPGIGRFANARGKSASNARGTSGWGDAWRPGSISSYERSVNVRGGGASNPLRNIQGLRPERVDQGVDYAGSGPIWAITSGTIVNTTNSGWPGGAFIAELMDSGPYQGKYWYVAENVTPTVRVGQHVTESTQIGILHNAFPNTEIGFAAAPGTGMSQANAAGQNKGEGTVTAFGKLASDWLVSLGAPAGIVNGPISGNTNGWPSAGAPAPGGAGASGGGTALYPMGNSSKGSAPSPAAAEDTTGGGKQEKAAFMAAIMGGAHGGSGYYGQNVGQYWPVTLPGGTDTTAAPSGGTSSGQGDFAGMQNTKAIADFLSGQGFNKNAVAGILGNMLQESGGNPNAGSNPPGKGLIQILGDPGGTLAQDLARTMAYINQNGSVADINNHSSSPAAAATWFEQKYERAGIPAMANRIAGANAAAALGYSSGGNIEVHDSPATAPDGPYCFAYSTAHPVYSGGRDLLPDDTHIILRFKAKSVEFNVPASAQEDVSNSNKSTMAKAEQLVNIHTLHSTISKGVK